MNSLIYLAIFILWVVTIIDIVKNVKDSGKMILWIVLVVVLPLVGSVLYYVIGKK